MQKRTREIAALVLLVLLGVGAVCGMGWYIFAGHGWNVAASNIDDSIGQMDGYTVVLFEGTRQEKTAVSPSADDANAPVDPSYSSGNAADASAAGAASDLLEPTDPSELVDIDLEGGVTIEKLSESYQEKGATVFRLDTSNKALYRDPFVVGKNDCRIGFFSIKSPARPAQARVAVKLLARQQSDFNVAITDDSSLALAGLNDIDIIICDDKDDEPAKGRMQGSSFCIDTPYSGQIEALIISPSGVISSKTIDSV